MTRAAPSQMRLAGQVFQNTQSMATAHSIAVYSKGAMTEAGALRKASVMKCWPRAPNTPSRASQGQWSARIGTQFGIDSRPAKSVSSTRNQNTSDTVLSVFVITRTDTDANA